MLRAYQSLRSQEDGFTLVEVLVVIVLIGIMATVSVAMIAEVFNANLEAAQMVDQTTTLTTLYGFLSSHLAVAQTPLGDTTSNATLCGSNPTPCMDPLSIAGDQVLFTSGGLCYRVFYVSSLKQIKAATSGNCSDAAVEPVRGPNETITNDGSCGQPPCHSGISYYDQALDLASGQPGASYVIASGVNPTRPSTAPSSYPSPLQVFQYLDASDNAQSVDTNACVLNNPVNPVQPCTHSSWYNTLSNRQLVSSVTATAYVDSAAVSSVRAGVIPSRAYQQNMSLQQVCAAPQQGSSGAVPGSVSDHQQLTYKATSGLQNLAANASGFADVKMGNGSSLQTPSITTQNGWVYFQGALTIQSSSSAAFTVRADLQTDRGGSWHSVSGDTPGGGDALGRPDFYWVEPVTSTTTSYPFTGSFKLPENTGSTDAPGTHYRVTIQIGDNSGQVNLVQGSSTDQWTPWIDYEVVAY